MNELKMIIRPKTYNTEDDVDSVEMPAEFVGLFVTKSWEWYYGLSENIRRFIYVIELDPYRDDGDLKITIELRLRSVYGDSLRSSFNADESGATTISQKLHSLLSDILRTYPKSKSSISESTEDFYWKGFTIRPGRYKRKIKI